MGHINFARRFPDAFVTIERGMPLALQGETPDAMYILLRGSVEVRVGGRVVALIKDPGAYIGEIAFILDRPASADCFVTRKASLLKITHDRAPELLRSSPAIAIKLARHMARRNRDLDRQRERQNHARRQCQHPRQPRGGKRRDSGRTGVERGQ